MPDGTPTAAQTLTKLTDGPLDVRLVRETTEAGEATRAAGGHGRSQAGGRRPRAGLA